MKKRCAIRPIGMTFFPWDRKKLKYRIRGYFNYIHSPALRAEALQIVNEGMDGFDPEHSIERLRAYQSPSNKDRVSDLKPLLDEIDNILGKPNV